MNKSAILMWAMILGVICFGVVVAGGVPDFTYQSLTNLGPCASSRVLLMNNDTNSTCPSKDMGGFVYLDFIKAAD